MELNVIVERNFSAISDEYREFAKEKDACRKCSVYENYKQVGQSEGNALNPTFMIIGEALGKDEVEAVRPFIGRAGQFLRKELRKYPGAFNKKNTLISNVLPCRPENNVFPEDRGGPYWLEYKNKRTPCNASRLIGHCMSLWLKREIELVKPKVIVMLGSKSLNYVAGTKGITANRGSWKFMPEFQAWSIATYHPSYVMRCLNHPQKDFVPQQFSADIENISKTWRSMMEDERLSMTTEEWNKARLLDISVKKGFAIPEPLDDWDSDD